MPSVGVFARFATDGDRRPSEVQTGAAWAPLYNNLWAASAGAQVSLGVVDRNPPKISVDYPEPFWMSPNNDGLADELLLPVEITDERFVMSWALVVEDADGALVRRIENKEARPENEGFRNLVDRLLYVRTGVDVPPVIRWDGFTESGTVAEDGTYTFFIEALDDNDNRGVSERKTVHVDNTPPEVIIIEPDDPDDLFFSPDGDGLKDTITIEQTSSHEDLWVVEILDSLDETVLRREFQDTALEDFTWDGRDASGTVVPDGVYTYRASATDRALNSGSATLANIIVDTVPTPVGLSVDVGHFSPNGNGRRDTITFTPDVPVAVGIRDYVLEILDSTGMVRRTFSGEDVVPDRWVFDGRDASGRLLPEGTYRTRLRVVYRNGNEPEALSPHWVLDITPPRISVIAEDDIFSPDGDGNKDTIAFLQDTDEALSWNSRIENEAGATVRTFSWSGRPETRLEWDGRTDEGTRAADGQYRYTLTGEDRAGNRASSTPIPFTLDTRETPVFITTAHRAFAPGTTGPRPVMDLLPELRDPRGAQRFVLEILDEQDRTVARIEDSGVPQNRYPWDGRGAGGGVVPDGTYRARLSVEYRHGNRPVALSAPFIVDTVAPQVQVSLTDPERAFSPDGDGLKDTMEIVQRSSREDLWTGHIESVATGEVVRRWNFSGELETLVWDGTNDSGQVVPDGEYRYVVQATDMAGNRGSAATPVFRSDTRDVEIRLGISRRAFRDTVTFTPESNIAEGVAEWRLRVLDMQNRPVWETARQGNLEPVVWNGAGVPDGEYRGELTVRYVTGANPQIRSASTVLLDRVPPEVRVTLSTDIISPNGDGRLDEVVISQQTSAEDRWTGLIRNAAGEAVRRWEWVGTAATEVVFAGLDDTQRRLPDGMYTYELTATDQAGNTGTSGPISLEIYTAETPLALSADLPAFSPNGDGVQDTITFTPRTGEARGLQRYVLTISPEAGGREVFREEGTRLPASFTWNGRRQGALAPEGEYLAELILEYRHGNRPVARSERFILDVTPPALTVRPDHRIFAPTGDGQRDTITITQESDRATRWTGRLVNAAGQTIREFRWADHAETFTWDGADEAGNTVPDGLYRYEITGRDLAGNTASATIDPIEVDTRSARLFLTLDRRIIAPGSTSGGAPPSVNATLITNRTDGGVSRTLEVIDVRGTVVRTLQTATVRDRETVVWDGRHTDGSVVDGEYTLRYAITFRNGTTAETRSPTLLVDSTAPRLAVQLQGLPFSPDNDGVNDELTILLSAEDAGGIASWSFEILDRNRRVFQQFTGSGQPRRQIIWDGRSRTGELVASAEDYPYRFVVTDRAGNRSETTGIIPIDILVIRDGDRLRIQIQNINFQPNSPLLQLDASTPEGAKNVEVLDRLVQIFDRYQTYRIQVEGHAVALLGTELEETRTLQPLSQARASSVRDALVQRGMEPGRINVVGRGGLEPIVPHTDVENRWRNRRVDFVLIR